MENDEETMWSLTGFLSPAMDVLSSGGAMIITCSLSHFLLVGVSLEIHPRVEHLEALVSEGTQPPSVRSASATGRPPFFKRAHGKSVYNR